MIILFSRSIYLKSEQNFIRERSTTTSSKETMDHIEQNQDDTPLIIFKGWAIDADDDEEFRAGYPFNLDELDEPDG